MKDKMSKEKKKKINIPQKIKDLSAFVSAIMVIAGALVAAGQWIVKEINASTNSRIDALEKTIDEKDLENKRAITRLELLSLIENDPSNVVEIEMVAKKYFLDYKGDTWATSVYSKYAKEYGADTSFVVYH